MLVDERCYGSTALYFYALSEEGLAFLAAMNS